jgi:hypothetical protein
MEEIENKDRDREEIFSRAIRAGTRTYFFDVKSTVGVLYHHYGKQEAIQQRTGKVFL